MGLARRTKQGENIEVVDEKVAVFSSKEEVPKNIVGNFLLLQLFVGRKVLGNVLKKRVGGFF
jgi:hypothetical protein